MVNEASLRREADAAKRRVNIKRTIRAKLCAIANHEDSIRFTPEEAKIILAAWDGERANVALGSEE